MADVLELDQVPNLASLYAKAVVNARGGGSALPEREAVVRDVPIDVEHLAAYARVCGFPLRDRVPSTYPHVVAFPLSVELMARKDFPFPLVGLVHLAQRIEQRRPLTTADRLDFRVRTEALRPHPKGRQFDVVADVEVDGDTVWTATSTYLRRGGGSEDAPPGRIAAGIELPADTPADATWRLPADTGRRYAAVSGDRNPIHLTRLTARLSGFPRPIAHGMWTAARCLAALEGRVGDTHVLEVAFKQPVQLPTTVALRTRATSDGWEFDLRDRSGERLHLVGRTAPV